MWLQCFEAGYQVIAARSPQAKGRVERNHTVCQDRLVEELRLTGISEIAAANAFLEGGYLDELNAEFAKPPIDSTDAHSALLATQHLGDTPCFSETRVVSADYVVQFENRLFHIKPEERRRLMKPGSSVEVRERLDGSLNFFTTDATAASGPPLGTSASREKFKLLFFDVGIVGTLCGMPKLFVLAMYLLALNAGAAAEQFVGQERYTQVYASVYQREALASRRAPLLRIPALRREDPQFTAGPGIRDCGTHEVHPVIRTET